ncbi:MAG: PKD domain-containing protein, partial [Chloroflexi bacterium]|nr:PKD domain-containing protein [Chloroflexota bacterium]
MKRLVLSVFTAICVLSLSIQFPIPVESAVPGAPATPIMLGGFPLSPTQVRVEWADSDNETGFRIERASISANFTEVGSVTANITSFTDDTVAVDTSYQYRVIAFNGAGDSDPSNVISVTVAAPNAPTDLAAFAMSATRVDLVWTDQSNNEASFRIERSLDGFATAPNATFPAVRNQRIFTDNTTSANNTYSYRVIAINAISESADSNVASVIVTSKLQAGPIDPDSIFQSNPNTGLPGYYQDDQGTRVSLLPITGNGIAAPTQIYDPPVLAEPYSVFLGYGTEAFYFYAENVFTMPNGGKVVTVFGIEAAFGGTGNATPGQEFVFNRTRIRIDVPMAGIYTVRHPYGAVSFNVTQADFIATGGRRAINYTNDIGVQRDFSATANDGNITRFLRQTTPSPSAGWIGDGASIGPVTGSPTGFNTVKIIGPPGSNLGGAGIDFVQSNDFMVSGRMPTAVTPIPGFTKTIDPVTSAAPATVTFTDTSTGAPTKWLWEFGDGTSSTSQNPPPKTYSTAGNYLVKLTVTNAVATVSTSQTVAIVSVPVASFVRSLPNGIPPVSINFTDSSTGNPTNWLWSFGDNSTSTLQNPSHIYAAPGTYTVNLTASNLAGVSYSSTLLGISPNLTANFTPSVFSGIAPLSANFTDTSIGNIESWLWDFGDNSTSASQNATKTYNTPGSYTVSLAVTDAVGSAGTSQVVNVYGALTANFTKSLIFGMMPLTVNFNDTSMGNPTSWLWSFGDNTTSTLQNPTKTYTAFGSYRVMLTVTNPTGTASTSQIVYVSTVDPTTLILQVGTNDPNSIYQGNLNTGFPSYYQDDQGTRVGLIPLTEGQIFDPPVADNAYSQLLGYGTEAFYWVASTVSPTSAGQMRALFGIEAAFGGVGDAVPGQEFVFVRTRIFADVPVAGNYTLQHPYGTLTIEVTADDVAAGGLRYVSDMGVQRDFLAAAAPNNGNVSRFLRPVTPAPLGWIGVGTIGPVTGSPLPTPFNKVRLTGPSGSNLGGPGIDFVETGQFAVNGRLFSTLTPSFTISLNPANSVVPVTANFT